MSKTDYRQVALINVSDFGAKGDGITDDTQAIINAIKAAGDNATILLTGIHMLGKMTLGSSYLENYFLPLKSNVQFIGINNATLKIRDNIFDQIDDKTSNAHIFQGKGINDVEFSNITFDMNGANNLTPQGHIRNAMAIRIAGGSNVTIKDCSFLNCAGRNVVSLAYYAGFKNKHALLHGNLFRNGGHCVGTETENVYNTDFSFISTEWDNSIVTSNVIEQENIEIALNSWSGGIEIHASNSEVASNVIRGCDPAIYIASTRSDANKLSYVSVVDNNIFDCLRGISFWAINEINNVNISSNNIVINRSTKRVSATSGGIVVPNGGVAVFDGAHANGALIKDINIIGNVISCNFADGDKEASRGLIMHSLHNAVIKSNKIYDMTDTGIVLLGSPWGNHNITIEDNTIYDCGRGNVLGVNPTENKSGIYLKLGGSANNPKLPFWTKNLFVNDNKIFNTHIESFNSNNVVVNNFCNGAMYAAICVTGFAEAMLESIWIKENNIWNIPVAIFGGVAPNLLEKQNNQAHFEPRILYIQHPSLPNYKVFQGDIIHYLSDNSVYKCTADGVLNCTKTGTVTGTTASNIISCDNSNQLRVGMSLQIIGAGSNGNNLNTTIVGINGNALTLDTAIITSVVNASYTVVPAAMQKFTNNILGYRNTAPTNDTYSASDIFYKINPAVGDCIGWICTVGGTPGTWLPFGVVGQKKIAAQANSAAMNIFALRSDFNALLVKLRNAGLM